MRSKGYKDLIVWRKSLKLVNEVYLLANKFQKDELYGLGSQIKRAAVSIPSNIAEGSKKNSKKDFKRFLEMAYGSGSELETQIEILKSLDFGKDLDYSKVDSLLDEVMKMLNVLIKKVY
jgi:four helix bundle protein